MKLNENEREIMVIYRKAKQDNDMNIIILIYAVVGMLLERQGSPRHGLLTGFTRGQYKRVIKILRAAQAQALRTGKPDVAADFDSTVRYIREHCLNKTATAA